MFAAVVIVLVVVLRNAPGLPRDSGPLPTLGGITSASRIEPLYSRVAGQLMGRKVEVRCWSSADWARLSREASAYTHGRFKPGPWSGYTDDKHKLANLPPRVCHRLSLLAYRRLVPKTDADAYWLSWSLTVLTANAEHIAGNRGVKAECFGMQLIAPAAASLGLDRKRAAMLARLYWRQIYLSFDPKFRSSECANGADLDLRPGDNAWP